MRSRFLLVSTLVAVAALAACKKSEEAKPAEPAPTAVTPPAAPVEVAKPHGDHDARHGGVVMMMADMHLEAVLGADGKHRIYFSDNSRDAVPASTMEKVSLTILRPGEAVEEIALAKGAGDEAWEGQGKPLAEPAKADVTVNFNKPGQPSAQQKIVFPMEHGEHGMEHGEHGMEHGGHGEAAEAPAMAPMGLKDAVVQLDAAYAELAAIVKDGDLSKAHVVADRLGKLGATLPELGGKAGLGADDVKALTVAGKKLQLFFRDMDEAGDSGKRDAAQKVFSRYKEPMDTIKAKAALAK